MATRTISTDIKLMGEKEFNDQMKAINSNLRVLSAQMNVATTAFNENADASTLLENRQSVLNAQIDQQKEKVRALSEMYNKCATDLGENSAQTDKYHREMLSAQATLNKMEAAQRKLNKEIEEAKVAEEAAKAIDKVEDAAEEAAPKVNKLAEKLKNLTDSTLDVVGAAPKAASRILQLAKSSEALQKAAGVTVSAAKVTGAALTGLALAGGGASVAITALAVTGFKTLADYAIEAAESGNPAFEGLAKNLELFNLASTRSKAALGGVLLPALEQLSGRGASLLNRFSAEITAAGANTEAIGGIMAKYVKLAAEEMRNSAPEFIKMGGGLVTGLAEGIVKNSDEISESLGETIEELATFLEDNADLIGQAAAVLVSNLGSMVATNAPQLFSAGISMIESLIKGINGKDLGKTAADLVLLLLTTLIRIAPDLFEAGVEFAFEVAKGILGADWNQIGSDIINAIWEGMKSLWTSVAEWFNEKVSSLTGTAYIDIVYSKQYGGMDESGGYKVDGKHATGLDYVPFDNYIAALHQGEMVVPASLATQLRAAGISSDTNSIGGGGTQAVAVTNNVKVSFEGSLSQLAQVLLPHIKVEQERVGPQLIS